MYIDLISGKKKTHGFAASPIPERPRLPRVPLYDWTPRNGETFGAWDLWLWLGPGTQFPDQPLIILIVW